MTTNRRLSELHGKMLQIVSSVEKHKGSLWKFIHSHTSEINSDTRSEVDSLYADLDEFHNRMRFRADRIKDMLRDQTQ
jgi:hypothetical protein